MPEPKEDLISQNLPESVYGMSARKCEQENKEKLEQLNLEPADLFLHKYLNVDDIENYLNEKKYAESKKETEKARAKITETKEIIANYKKLGKATQKLEKQLIAQQNKLAKQQDKLLAESLKLSPKGFELFNKIKEKYANDVPTYNYLTNTLVEKGIKPTQELMDSPELEKQINDFKNYQKSYTNIAAKLIESKLCNHIKQKNLDMIKKPELAYIVLEILKKRQARVIEQKMQEQELFDYNRFEAEDSLERQIASLDIAGLSTEDKKKFRDLRKKLGINVSHDTGIADLNPQMPILSESELKPEAQTDAFQTINELLQADPKLFDNPLRVTMLANLAIKQGHPTIKKFNDAYQQKPAAFDTIMDFAQREGISGIEHGLQAFNELDNELHEKKEKKNTAMELIDKFELYNIDMADYTTNDLKNFLGKILAFMPNKALQNMTDDMLEFFSGNDEKRLQEVLEKQKSKSSAKNYYRYKKKLSEGMPDQPEIIRDIEKMCQTNMNWYHDLINIYRRNKDNRLPAVFRMVLAVYNQNDHEMTQKFLEKLSITNTPNDQQLKEILTTLKQDLLTNRQKGKAEQYSNAA